MQREESLAEKLRKYTASGIYPMHMPGHKRNVPICIKDLLCDIYSIDVTEVEGTDNLHQAEGIILQAMQYAAKVYGARDTFFLVNGSSGGILSAMHCCSRKKKKVLMTPGAHISAYHGLELFGLEPIFVDTEYFEDIGITAGLNPEKVMEKIREQKDEFAFVYITSPTYEGVILQVREIADIAHAHHIPLIVDEAHGAHLHFLKQEQNFSALDCGADLVIQSVHKTLPSLTQTAILHIQGEMISRDEMERSLTFFETSSPSYILMSAIDGAIRYMDEMGKKKLAQLWEWQQEFRAQIGKLNYVFCWNPGQDKTKYMAGIDQTKLILGAKINGESMFGEQLQEILRRDYSIETEMSGVEYTLAMLTVGDDKEGIDRLLNAMKDIDWRIHKEEIVCWPREEIPLSLSVGDRAHHFVYAYPPDIPILRPGEIVSEEKIEIIKRYLRSHCHIVGL